MANPNWKRFQSIVADMVENKLGGEPCTIKAPTPGAKTYDYKRGESISSWTTIPIKAALIKTTKDDLVNLPEGLADKVLKKIITISPLAKDAIVTSDNDGIKYAVAVQSAGYSAGGITHAYVTFVAKIENNQK